MHLKIGPRASNLDHGTIGQGSLLNLLAIQEGAIRAETNQLPFSPHPPQFHMVPRYHGTIENHMVIDSAANPDDRFMLKGPVLHRGRLNRMEKGKANHDVGVISVRRVVGLMLGL